VDDRADVRQDRHWWLAVWALRAGFGSLVVVLAGVVLLATGITPWVLTAGVVGWLVSAVVTLTGVVLAWRSADPRPGFWATRWQLLRDTVHRRPGGPPG
jgi:uncharacterized membrane protein